MGQTRVRAFRKLRDRELSEWRTRREAYANRHGLTVDGNLTDDERRERLHAILRGYIHHCALTGRLTTVAT